MSRKLISTLRITATVGVLSAITTATIPPLTAAATSSTSSLSSAFGGSSGSSPLSPEVSSAGSSARSSKTLYSDFYNDPPNNVSSAPHGTLLREQKMSPSRSRILYSSQLESGSPTYVSGAVLQPTAPWKGKGSAPTVILAPGTRGMADNCAASRGPGFSGQFAPLMSALGINYELPFYKDFTDRGIRLIVTDYIGLGTPGTHSYANRIEQGHAVLDAARAVLAADADAGVAGSFDTPVGIFGYSQGGGAAAAAAELAATYAPELNLKATFAGAPPADLRAVLANPTLGPVAAYAITGFSASDPEFSHEVNAHLSLKGRVWLWENAHSCILDSSILWGLTQPSSLLNSHQSMTDVIDAEPHIAETLDRQKLGTVAPTGAILISSAPDDNVVPHGQAMQLAADYEALGADVETLTDSGPALSSRVAGGHAGGLIGQFGTALDWLIKHLK